MGQSLLKTIDDKFNELIVKVHAIEASNEEVHNKLNKNIEGMGETLLRRIDDKIDALIARQDRIFEELTKSRDEQNNTVNVFKHDAADLIFKVNEVSEKIVDFEKNKRNNLILFGIPNDPHETPTTLDAKV